MSSAATSWSPCPKATSGSPAIPRRHCADEGCVKRPVSVLRPSLRANGSRECAPDDRLRAAIQSNHRTVLDCFVASLLSMTANANYSVGWEGITMGISQTEGGASPVDVARASPVDVAEFIDRQPVGGFQIRLLLSCGVVSRRF